MSQPCMDRVHGARVVSFSCCFTVSHLCWLGGGGGFPADGGEGVLYLFMPRSHIHRAPHDCSCPVLPGGLPWILETVVLPCEFNFCGVCGPIFYDVRAVPFKNWKRRP